MRTPTILAALMMLALCSCDKYESDVHTGQDARDQAKAVVAADAGQKIAMARQLISVGKVADAKSILDPLSHDPSKLPEATQQSLAAAMKELEQAQASR